MGRKRGFLALEIGICRGAEVILIPEKPLDLPGIIKVMNSNAEKGKRAGIIVATEGYGDSSKISSKTYRNKQTLK